MYIEPLPEHASISIPEMCEAGEQWRRNPAQTSDRQLQILSTYDRDMAATGWARREKAREAEYLKQFEAPPAPPPAAVQPNAVVCPTEDDLASAEKLETWAEKHAVAAVPVLLWQRFVAAAREKRENLEAQVSRLESLAVLNENRLTELEHQKAKAGVNNVRWAGVHEPGATYREGELVSRNGLWLCKAATTTATPGGDPDSWQLIVRAKSRDVE
jgi:hypothetical protein